MLNYHILLYIDKYCIYFEYDYISLHIIKVITYYENIVYIIIYV
jgi:hypothetical protein